MLGRFARGSTAAPGGPGWGWRWWPSRPHCTAARIELSDGPLGGLRATLTVSTSAEPLWTPTIRLTGSAREAATATAPAEQQHGGRQRSHHDEADRHARGSELCATAFRSTTVHTQTTRPVGATRERTAPAADQQPADGGAGQERPRGLRDTRARSVPRRGCAVRSRRTRARRRRRRAARATAALRSLSFAIGHHVENQWA